MRTRYVIYSATMQDCYSYLASFPEYVFRLFIYKLQETGRTNNLFYTKKSINKINQIHVIDRMFTRFPHNIHKRSKGHKSGSNIDRMYINFNRLANTKLNTILSLPDIITLAQKKIKMQQA